MTSTTPQAQTHVLASRALWTIVFVAVAVRVLYVVLVAGPGVLTPWGTSDAPDYVAIAANLAAGHGFARNIAPGSQVGDWRVPVFAEPPSDGARARTAYRPPLYPAFLSLTYRLSGEGRHMLVRLEQAILSGLSVAVVGWIATALSGSIAAGLLAALLLAVNPLHVYFAGELLTESLFGVLVVLVLACLSVRTVTLRRAVALGALVGAAVLTRPTAAAFVPVGLIAVASRSAGSHRGRAVGVRAAGWFLAALAACVGPWAARNTLLFGVPTLVSTNGGVNLVLGISREWTATIGAPDLALIDAVPEVSARNEAEWDRALVSLARERIADDPARFAQLFVRKLGHFFSPVLSHEHRVAFRAVGIAAFLPLLAGVLLWPVVCAPRRSDHARATFVLMMAAVAAFALAHSLSIANVRFRVPVAEPVFAIFSADAAATGVAVLTAWWRRRRTPPDTLG